jgi:hypothetical protein
MISAGEGNDMTVDGDSFLESLDEAACLVFLENKGDELTDILVASLEETLEILRGEQRGDVVH